MYRHKAIMGILIFALSFGFSFASEKQKIDENLYILQALMAIDNSKHKDAVAIYKKLYEATGKKAYLKEALKFAFFANSEEVKELIRLGEKNLQDDTDFLRIKSTILMSESKFDEAGKIMKKLISKEDKARNHIVMGTILTKQNKLDEALEEYKKAYELEKSDENLLRIAGFLFERMNKKSEAISYLETSRRINGCSVHVCAALVEFYGSMGQLNNTIEIYEGLYEVTKDKNYLDKALGVYVYQKNYDDGIKFLQKHGHNDEAMMEIYAIKGDFDGALKKAKELFDKTFNLEYQARMAIYQYERDMKNISKKSLDEVALNFEKSVFKLDNAVYLNYYGYLLIDRDIDVKKGVGLVEKALVKEPNSPYYIDSLAWGYYKLGECKKADEIMQKAMGDSEFTETKEAQEHIRLIKECLKKGAK